jgi:hypothetical protein
MDRGSFGATKHPPTIAHATSTARGLEHRSIDRIGFWGMATGPPGIVGPSANRSTGLHGVSTPKRAGSPPAMKLVSQFLELLETRLWLEQVVQ